MSSWKKASKSNQKVHRERHQPEARQHQGLLEKKKDYRARARNAQHKEKLLKVLHQRALQKNPDEFYHHMINSKLHDGVHHEGDVIPLDEHSKAQVALMEQDKKYIVMKRTMEIKKIRRLQSHLHMIDFANTVPNKHTFFVDGQPRVLNRKELAARLDTHPSLLERKTNRPHLHTLEQLDIPELTPEEIRQANTLQQREYQELSKRVERERELSIVQQKMQMQHVLKQPRLQKPKRVKKGTKDAPPVYRFKYERKK